MEINTFFIECLKLEERRKIRSSIYDLVAKEDAARAFKRPLDHFYNWPFRHWIKVSKMLCARRKQVEQECLAMGMPHNTSWINFPYYRKQMGY